MILLEQGADFLNNTEDQEDSRFHNNIELPEYDQIQVETNEIV